MKIVKMKKKWKWKNTNKMLQFFFRNNRKEEINRCVETDTDMKSTIDFSKPAHP